MSDAARMAWSWARRRAPLVLLPAAAALATSAWGAPPAGADLGALAEHLGASADHFSVAAQDIRWEPSGGALADLLFGRWLLFLASAGPNQPRDVWRARVRLSPEGSALAVHFARNLSNTPLGDDHELVLRGRYAAYATRAYGQEQSVTLLDLDGEGAQNKATLALDRVLASLTNIQRTGSAAGLGRVDVTFEGPSRAVGLSLGEASLSLALYGVDPRLRGGASEARLDLATGELRAPGEGARAEGAIHLPKRFSHWLVDTLRAFSFIGPAPVAWAEDQALGARDAVRRLTFAGRGDATEVVATGEPQPPVLDTSQTSVEEAHWPPPNVPTIWKSAEPGEGEWSVPEVPWLRHPEHLAADAPSAFYATFVRPDEDRPYAKVLLVAMDMRQLELDMEAGVEDPEPLTGPLGPGRVPRDPAIYRRVAAAFNGAFKTEHGHYGMMVHKRVLLPPVPFAATVATTSDGRVLFGSWGAERKIGGIVGVADDDILSFRQNLEPLVDHGKLNPNGRNLWGFTLPGTGAQTERTGLCVTTSGHMVYAWGDDVNATSLAKAMQMAGCDYALHLDMNPHHTGFLFTAIDELPRKYKSQLLTTNMSIPVDRYVQYSPKDFFYVLAHDPAPAAVSGATPWESDPGAQPPPHWIPALWTCVLEDPEGQVRLLDIEPGRATFRVRAGEKDAPLAMPLRGIAGEEARHVLFAAGMGIGYEKRPYGLGTDGKLAASVQGESGLGVLIVREGGQLAIESSPTEPLLAPHEDLVELPVAVWDGRVLPAPQGEVAMRSALGLAPSGQVVLARGGFASVAPLAAALVRAGCTRAVALDRGVSASGLLDRAGTERGPRSKYSESVLYAVGTALKPRASRFEATVLAAQTAKPK